APGRSGSRTRSTNVGMNHGNPRFLTGRSRNSYGRVVMEHRRLTPRGRERRRQLIDFAARRFAERGFHPTSVAEIVAGLGVGKGVFYWYFESKDDLLFAILR